MSDDKKDKNDAESSTLKDVGWFALKTTAISGAVLGGTAAALPLIGFSGGGVVGGSLAAAYQSTFLGGTIVSGSVFASMQSAAVAGLAGSTQAAVVAGSALVAGAHTALKKLKKNDETDSGHTSEESSENNKEDDVDEEPGGNDRAELLEKNCKDPGLKTEGSIEHIIGNHNIDFFMVWRQHGFSRKFTHFGREHIITLLEKLKIFQSRSQADLMNWNAFFLSKTPWHTRCGFTTLVIYFKKPKEERKPTNPWRRNSSTAEPDSSRTHGGWNNDLHVIKQKKTPSLEERKGWK
nr:uncharacterized protein LOC107454833 [Parasteatoda tepidariorum]